MANFARQISDLILYQELDRSARRDGIDQAEVDRLKGLVNDVAETVGPVMAQIPVTFRQYTVHDIRHCRNVIDRMGDILPEETRSKLNALEITFLLLSALLHDIGMVVSDSEKAETQRSESFRRFREEGHSDRSKAIEDARTAGNEPRARAIEDALLAEYYRRLHPERVRQFMESHLSGKLRYQEVDFSDDLARLCESHAWGVEESNDGRHPEKAVARLDDNVRLYGVRVNLQYLACILRLADILDFDRSRTPLAVFQHLDFTEPKSWEEWNKHLQVKGWEITPTQVGFEIPCTQPVFYVAVHEFLGWIDDELRQCRYILENKPQATAERYKLLTPQIVDRHKVRMADPSYIAGAFRFQLEYENILQLLMDKSLYPDPSLFLRELLQNALDACRRKEAEMEVAGLKKFYKPKISVWDLSNDPRDPHIIFQDNGIGMSQRIIEQYFLRVGRSYYRSPEFDAERQRLREKGRELNACSQFGIGILSCFLIGDRFEVETYQSGYDPLRVSIEGPAKYFIIQRLPRSEPNLFRERSTDEKESTLQITGTRIIVHCRPGVEVDVWGTLNSFAANVDFPIIVLSPSRRRGRSIRPLRWNAAPQLEDYILPTDSELKLRAEGLKEVLVTSRIPFARWNRTRHIQGCSWFWLLRGPDGRPTPQCGFISINEGLNLEGIVSFLGALERRYSGIRELQELASMLEKGKVDAELAYKWHRLLPTEKDLFREIVVRRVGVLEKTTTLSHWTRHPEVVQSLLEGSIKWADFPISLRGTILSSDERMALHAIRIPQGIVDWDPVKVNSARCRLLPAFGGFKVDLRGSKAPRPAVHRLFIPLTEAYEFCQSYMHVALLHGMELVEQNGKTKEWRRWFCSLVASAMMRGLDKVEFAKESGHLLEESYGFKVISKKENLYLSRADIRKLLPGRVFLGDATDPCLDKWDSINLLLYDGQRPGFGHEVEVDISDLPIRAK